MIGDKLAARFAKRLRDVSAEYKTAAQRINMNDAGPHVASSQLAVSVTLDVLAALVCEIFEVS